jgi:cysteine desulfurase
MEKIRYFDHAATTATKDEVLREMLPYYSLNYGNPSSMYSIGRKARKAVEDARRKVAYAIGAKPKEIYFTSGGSESDNLALKGVAHANKNRGNHIITSKIEHPAVLNSCKCLEKEGFRVTYINVDEYGFIKLDELENSICNQTILISIMFANNEIGTIQPIKEIGKIAKRHNIYFHTDSVQAIGNAKINVEELNIDLLSMSAHKFYGPKGIGALYVKEGVNLNKIQDGGHQEKNMRAGTENVAGIVGLGKAIELSYENFNKYNQKLVALRDYYISQVEQRIPNVKLNGNRENRLPGNANFSFKNIDGEELLLKLDSMGICASAGSACTSGTSTPSHVLMAIGLPFEMASGTLRVSFGEDNTKADVDFLVDSLERIVSELRS